MPKYVSFEIPDNAVNVSGEIEPGYKVAMWTTPEGRLICDIAESLVGNFVVSDTPTPNPTTVQEYRVVSNVLNVRSAPTTLVPIVRRYVKGDKVRITGIRDRWGTTSVVWLWGQLEDGNWVAMGEVNQPTNPDDHTIKIWYVQLVTDTGG